MQIGSFKKPSLPSLSQVRKTVSKAVHRAADRTVDAVQDGFDRTRRELKDATRLGSNFGLSFPKPKDILKNMLRSLVEKVRCGAPGLNVSKLSEDQLATLKGVYGENVDFSNVRLVQMPRELEAIAKLVNGGDARAFTVGNVIMLPKDDYQRVTTGGDNALLVHEAAHVLQYRQDGLDVAIESVVGQLREGGDFYSWEDDLAAGKGWDDLNVESRSHLIDEAYTAGFFDGEGNRLVLSEGGDDHLVIGPGEPVPDGYIDVTPVVTEGLADLSGRPNPNHYDRIDDGTRVA